MTELPLLYPILDAESLTRAGISLEMAARELREAGVSLLQYRDKTAADADVVAGMRMLRGIFPAGDAVLLLNDRVHLCDEAQADGVHIGQQDMPPQRARRLLGRERLLGVSTHTVAQARAAVATGAPDYLAIGPVFATSTKQNPDPVAGVDGVRAARELTRLPLVAIGGITGPMARPVLEAGADAVAVISGLLPEGDRNLAQRVRDFLAYLR